MSARHAAPSTTDPAPRAAGPAGSTGTTGTSDATSTSRKPIGRLAVRTVVYLLTALAWTALWLVILALAWGLPLGLAGEPLADKPGIMALSSDLRELGAFLLVLPVLALLFGWVVLLMPFMAWPLAVLSFVYVGRSLRRQYAGEPLSSTTWSRDVLGPVTVTSKAMSLLPVRHSRFTDLMVLAYSIGWSPSFRMILACTPFGVAYLFTIGWVLWPVTNPVLVVAYALVALALAAWSIVLLVPAVRARVSDHNREG